MQRLHNWSRYWNETNWEILCILNQYKTVPLLSNSDKCKTMGTGRNTSFKSAYAGILNQMDSKYNMNCLKNTPTGFEFYSSVNNISEMPALVILIFLTISFFSFLFVLLTQSRVRGWLESTPVFLPCILFVFNGKDNECTWGIHSHTKDWSKTVKLRFSLKFGRKTGKTFCGLMSLDSCCNDQMGQNLV